MSIDENWYQELAERRVRGEGTLRMELLKFWDNSAPKSRNDYPKKRTIRDWSQEPRSINLKSCKFLIAFCDYELAHLKKYDSKYIQKLRFDLLKRHQQLESIERPQQFGFLSSLISHNIEEVDSVYEKYYGHYYVYSRLATGQIVKELLLFGPQRESYVITYLITYQGDVFYGYLIPSKLNLNIIFLRPNSMAEVSFRMLNLKPSLAEDINRYNEIRGIWLRNSTEYFEPMASQVLMKRIAIIKEFDYSLHGNRIYKEYSTKTFQNEEKEIVEPYIGTLEDGEIEYAYVNEKLADIIEYK